MAGKVFNLFYEWAARCLSEIIKSAQSKDVINGKWYCQTFKDI